VIGSGGLAGFLLALFIQAVQLGVSQGIGVWDSIVKMIDHAGTRLHTDADKFSNIAWADGIDAWVKAADASVFEVLNIYWNGVAVDFSTLFGRQYSYILNYKDIVLIFAIFNVVEFILCRYSTNIRANRKKIISLTIATWTAFFAPISWYVLAKVHSYIHGHLNQVLWHIPFTLLGFLLVGVVIADLWGELKGKYGKSPDVLLAIGVTIVAVVILSTSYVSSSNFDTQLDAKLANASKIIAGERFDVYLSGDELIYLKSSCSKSDTKEYFFLHYYPYDKSALPENRKQPDFLNMDFSWETYSVDIPLFSKYSGFCHLSRELPDFAIKVLGTGQLVYRKYGNTEI